MSIDVIPNVVENMNGNDQMTNLFDRELVKNRTIYISGPIDSATALLTVLKINYLADISDDPITIRCVDSPGGSVSAGMAIYDAMQTVECPVVTICMGTCASMAAVLFAAGSKGKRYIMENAQVMCHQPSAGTQGMVSSMDIDINHFKKEKDRLSGILAKHTGQNRKRILKDTEKDRWFSAEEAVAYGLADEIIKAKRKE